MNLNLNFIIYVIIHELFPWQAKAESSCYDPSILLGTSQLLLVYRPITNDTGHVIVRCLIALIKQQMLDAKQIPTNIK